MKTKVNGSDLRQKLVTLYKRKKLREYDDLTNKIIYYYVNGDRAFFIHLNKKFRTFSKLTKICLMRALTRAQEEAIEESMPFLHEIMAIKNYQCKCS